MIEAFVLVRVVCDHVHCLATHKFRNLPLDPSNSPSPEFFAEEADGDVQPESSPSESSVSSSNAVSVDKQHFAKVV
jgi:hypothetical protein